MSLIRKPRAHRPCNVTRLSGRGCDLNISLPGAAEACVAGLSRGGGMRLSEADNCVATMPMDAGRLVLPATAVLQKHGAGSIGLAQSSR